MIGRFLAYCVICFAMAAPFNSLAGEVGIKKLNKSKWIQLETENFIVITDEKEKQAKEMAFELEHFRYFMAFLLGYEQHYTTKVPVILAKNKSSFKALGFSENFAGMFVQNNGYVIFARADGFKSSAQGKGNWGRSVVLHELVHLLVNNSSLNLARPLWYNEGIAEYFGTYLEKDSNIILGDMTVLGDRFYDMLTPAGGRFESIDSESLFKTKQSDLDFHAENTKQNREIGKFYARSTAVVHYLNSDQTKRQQLYYYLGLINKGFSVDETFAHVFKMSYAEFDQEIQDYMFGKYVMARTFPVGKNGIEFPSIAFNVKPIEQRRAMEILFEKIMMLPQPYITNEDRETMYKDLEKIYPDFFAPRNNEENWFFLGNPIKSPSCQRALGAPIGAI